MKSILDKVAALSKEIQEVKEDNQKEKEKVRDLMNDKHKLVKGSSFEVYTLRLGTQITPLGGMRFAL